jgi:hypothetical protein
VSLAFHPVGVFKARAWQYNRCLAQAGGELTFACAVAVTSARCAHPLRLGRTQGRLQLLLNDRFNQAPDSFPNLCLDGIGPPIKPFFPNSLPCYPFP